MCDPIEQAIAYPEAIYGADFAAKLASLNRDLAELRARKKAICDEVDRLVLEAKGQPCVKCGKPAVPFNGCAPRCDDCTSDLYQHAKSTHG